MNVLEKILEEIEEKRKGIIDMSDEEPELRDVEDWLEEGEKDGKMKAYQEMKEIIQPHMDEAPDDDWIPVSKRLPKEHEIVRVTVHSSEWISDYYSDWIPENEKIYHAEEYNVYDGYIDKSGDWTFFDEDLEIRCDKKFGADKSVVYSVVTAWMPKTYPKPYCPTEE